MTHEAFTGKRVLVTGAGRGIGSAIAEAFAHQGAIVGVHYRSSATLATKLAERLRLAGCGVELVEGDLLDPKVRRDLVPRFMSLCGGIDVLVNNAGAVIKAAHCMDVEEDIWQQSFDLNVTAPFVLGRAAMRAMQRQHWGRIINISSIGVKYGGSAHTLHYSAAKAALEAITVGLAKVGAEWNILVNAVRPGIIETQLHGHTPPDDFRRRVELIPLKRPGTPEDVAAMVLFLASPAGDFITGQVFAVSGGD